MSEFNPKVSVVIPVYNGSNYLAEAIDSALAQTYKNIEIIVIDDGSRDNGATGEVAQRFGDKIRYVRKENGGVSTALNCGIELMTGEYFSWLSHDDTFCTDKIETQIEYIRNNPTAKFICGEFEKVDSHGIFITKISQDEYKIIKNGRQALSVYIFGCTTLIHKSCFEEIGKFNEKNRTTSDDEMWLRIIKKFPLHYINKLMCKERQHSAQVGVRDLELHGKNRLIFFKYIYDECDIDWFLDSRQDVCQKSTAATRSEAYAWIGSYAQRLNCYEGADLFMKAAIKEWPLNIRALMITLLRPRFIGYLTSGRDRLLANIVLVKSAVTNKGFSR